MFLPLSEKAVRFDIKGARRGGFPMTARRLRTRSRDRSERIRSRKRRPRKREAPASLAVPRSDDGPGGPLPAGMIDGKQKASRSSRSCSGAPSSWRPKGTERRDGLLFDEAQVSSL